MCFIGYSPQISESFIPLRPPFLVATIRPDLLQAIQIVYCRLGGQILCLVKVIRQQVWQRDHCITSGSGLVALLRGSSDEASLMEAPAVHSYNAQQ